MLRISIGLVISCLCSGCFVANRYVINRLYREDFDVRRSEVQRVDFCSLPEHTGQIVRTKAIYSGLVEYWDLEPVIPCKSGHTDSTSVWPGSADYPMPVLPWQWNKKRKLRKIHSEYWKYDAIVDMEGYFETGDELGYGHMNSSTSQFVITYIRSIKLIRKRTNGT